MADGYWEFRRGSGFVLQEGHRYEVVYRPETLGATLHADKETVHHVVGGRPGVAVERVKVDFVDSEVHVWFQAASTEVIDIVLPVQLQVVPADEWIPSPVAVIGNVFGIEGVAVIDRIKHLGEATTPFQEAEAAEEKADAELDEGNVRNTLSELLDAIRKSGQTVTALAVTAGLLGLVVALRD